MPVNSVSPLKAVIFTVILIGVAVGLQLSILLYPEVTFIIPLDWILFFIHIIVALTFLLYLNKIEGLTLLETSSKHVFHFGTILLVSLMAIGYEIIKDPIVNSNFIYHYLLSGREYVEFESGQMLAWKFTPMVITSLAIAPFFEEVVFRRFLFQGLINSVGITGAILLSSSLFALIHFENPINIITTFILGFLSALIYYKTKNIYWSIYFHVVANVISISKNILASSYQSLISMLNYGLIYWIMVIIGIMTIGLVVRKMLRS